MILACPNCAVRFRVADRALQPDGRRLRCGRCRHEWQVDADGIEPGRRRLPPEPVFEPPGPGPEREPEPVPEPVPVFAIPDEPPVISAPPARPRRDRTALLRLIRRSLAWTVAGIAVLGLAGAIYMHEVVAVEVPWTRPVYRLVQLMPEMSSDGLALDNLRTDPELARLDPAALPRSIRVGGDVRNTTWVPRSIATLEGRLYDRRRLELNRWYFEPDRRWLWPGEATSFSAVVPIDTVRPAELTIRLSPLAQMPHRIHHDIGQPP